MAETLDLFDGETYDEELDFERLKNQLDRVRALMLDGTWRTLYEIADRIYANKASIPSISSRLRDLRKAKFGGWAVESRRREGEDGLWEYRVRGRLNAVAQGAQPKPDKPSPTEIKVALREAQDAIYEGVKAGYTIKRRGPWNKLFLWLGYLAGEDVFEALEAQTPEDWYASIRVHLLGTDVRDVPIEEKDEEEEE